MLLLEVNVKGKMKTEIMQSQHTVQTVDDKNTIN